MKNRWINDDEYEVKQIETISRQSFSPEEAMTYEQIKHFNSTTDHIPRVITIKNKIVGYCFYVLRNQIVTIHQLAVKPEYRRQGVATFAIEKLKASLVGLRKQIIATDVAETNLPGQLFLKSRNFEYFRTLHTGDPGNERYAFRFYLEESNERMVADVGGKFLPKRMSDHYQSGAKNQSKPGKHRDW